MFTRSKSNPQSFPDLFSLRYFSVGHLASSGVLFVAQTVLILSFTQKTRAATANNLFESSAYPQASRTLAVPPDSSHWVLEGQAKPAEYQARKCLVLNGGAATVKDFEMRDAVVDVDVATPACRGFFGIQFRISSDGANAEWVYLRQHKPGLPDALQYTPVLNTGLNWQIYNGTGFTVQSTSQEMSGFTCASRLQVPRRSFMSKIWTSPRSSLAI